MARRMSRPRPGFALRWASVGVLALVALLYYRPLRTYVDTHRTLSARRAEVRSLSAQNHLLERRVAASGSLAALEREARRLGYVKPGEHLFIVQGISEWQKRLRATLRRHG